jgi:hypothetical protein
VLQSVLRWAPPTPGPSACLYKVNLEWLTLEAEVEFLLPMREWRAYLRRTQ